MSDAIGWTITTVLGAAFALTFAYAGGAYDEQKRACERRGGTLVQGYERLVCAKLIEVPE